MFLRFLQPRAFSLSFCTAAAALSGCAGLTQMQDSLSKFDTGAHAVALAQMHFLDKVHSIGCEQQFYAAASDFAAQKSGPLDLRNRCTAAANTISSAQLRTRQKLFDAITLYADQLQALGASSDDDATLSTNMETAANNLNRLATDRGLSTADASLPRNVEQAVATLTRMVIDHRRYTDIKAAAQSQQANLALVVDTLKTENLLFAAGVDSAIGTIRAGLTESLLASRDRQGPGVMTDVVLARTYLQAMQPYGASETDDASATNATGAAGAGIGTPVLQLNRALDSLLAANAAIAEAGNGGVRAAVADLVVRAQAAQTFKAALTQ